MKTKKKSSFNKKQILFLAEFKNLLRKHKASISADSTGFILVNVAAHLSEKIKISTASLHGICAVDPKTNRLELI